MQCYWFELPCIQPDHAVCKGCLYFERFWALYGADICAKMDIKE